MTYFLGCVAKDVIVKLSNLREFGIILVSFQLL